jgi:glycosyltransferase involved in cell wall biosynthesis
LKSKKILIVTECFYPEEFKINDLALSWKNKGYEVDILTLVPTYPFGKIYKGYKNKIFNTEVYQGMDIFRIRAVTGYQHSLIKKMLKYINFMILGSIKAIFIGKSYDYVFGFNMSSLTDMLPAIVIRKLYKKPLMLWVQDTWPDSVYAYGFKKTKILSFLLNTLVKFVYQNITAIAISSKGFELKLKEYVKDDLKFHYLPNWADDLNMDIDAFEFSKDDRVQFTFAGNIGKVQNLDNIIKAFCLISDKSKTKAQLNIIGDGSNLKYLKELSEKNQHVIFHGKKRRENMSKFYKGSDFLIVSLIDEPIFSVTVPAKTQTYIAAKKPILAIINGDTADIVRDNNLGLSVNPSNIGLIVDAFEQCIDMSKEEKNNFVENSDRLIKATFNKDLIISRITKVLVG